MPVQSAAMQWLAFACSAGLLIYCAHRLAARFAQGGAEHFFSAIAFAAMQIGTLAVALSFFNLVAPAPWLATQTLVMLPIAWFVGRSRKIQIRLPVSFRATQIIVALIVLMIWLTALKQIWLPVSNLDDRNYHASRVAYWLEHQNIFPWVTHNDRQTVFPLSGQLIFFWPILFTRSEAPALATFWLAYPFAVAAVFLILRELRQSPLASAIGALLFCFTPMVMIHTRGVNPEMWMAFYALGCAFWTLRAIREPSATRFFFAGVFAALAVSCKATATPLLLIVPLLPWIIRSIPRRLRATGFTLAGAACGIALGGSIIVFATNIARYHHPLGPQAFREIHSAQLSGAQLRTHAVRTVVTLLEPPASTPSMARALERAYTKLIALLHADRLLPMEDQEWPGHFQAHIKPFGENYSLPGLLWLPALLVGIALGLRQCDIASRQMLALSLLAAFMFAAAVFRIRWMGGMGRFWIASFGLALPIIIALLAPLATRMFWLRIVFTLAVGFIVCVGFIARIIDTIDSFKQADSPTAIVVLEYPFFEARAQVPRGSSILLVGDQAATDYPLFVPREGFANRVVSWGKSPFDAQRMQKLLSEEKVDHIIIQNDERLEFKWDPPLDTSPMAKWLDENANWTRVPLPFTPGMRLYARKDGH